jgi:hypothetical protein
MASVLERGFDVTKDFSSKGVLGITYAHAAVHRDIIARATRVVAAGTGILNVLFKNPGPLQGHFEWRITASADCEVRLYTAPTVTAEGDSAVITRLFLPSTVTTQGVVKTGGTVSAKGTLADEQWNGGTSAVGNNLTLGGSVVHDDAEYIPDVDGWCLIEIDRKSETKLSIVLEWYEVAEIT